MRAESITQLCSLFAFTALCACGSTNNITNVYVIDDAGVEATAKARSDAGLGNPPPSSEAGAPDATLAGTDAGSVNSYLAGLPGWPPPQPDVNAPAAGADAGAPNYVTGTDGIQYACTSTPWSLTRTPTQIVTFNPNVDVLWPGALVQGGPYQNGQIIGLPITQRAPIVVSIPTLLSTNNSLLVQNPTVASTETAVGSIIAAAISAGVEASSSVSYTQTEAHSTSQVALALGFSADFVGGNLAGQLNLSESANLNTVVGYFVQSMFTVTVPEPEQQGDLFEGLTQDTLNALTAKGDVGPTNLPLYVASIVYGRIMMFSITSSQSTSNIEAALSAEFHGLVASGSVQTKYSSLINDSSTSFRVVTVGGSAANAEALINTGDPSKFFDSNPAISTGVPISYVVRNLSDNSVAGVSETTSYSVKTCEATATTGAAYYVVDNQSQGIDTFDALGNGVTL
ncbi:MAG: thiol-activated cytolysin family protein, partial [Polyangiaceae bacterium]